MIRMPNSQATRRQGFTIVELLVALALVLFIMSIISQVFVDASEAFRSARSKAELTEKLRFITQTLRADLRSRHFENGRKLSDPEFWRDGPPKTGYFRLEHKPLVTVFAPDGVTPITNNLGEPIVQGNPGAGHLIAFTCFQKAQNPSDFYSVSGISNPLFAGWKNGSGLSPQDTRFEDNATFNSPDAEISWFLGPDGPGYTKEYPLQDEVGAPATIKVFSLYRRMWLLAPNKPDPSAPMPAVAATDGVGVNPNQLPLTDINFGQWNTDLPNTDVPLRRSIGFGYPASGSVTSWKDSSFQPLNVASDPFLIANNVLSFSVEVLNENGTQFFPLQSAIGSKVFDTWSSRPYGGNDFSKWNVPGDLASIPMIPSTAPMGTLPPRITAIRVTIRLYDTNNALSPSKTTWQATLVEPL
jgi:prepilin-type N-terminal cleavage/methylation domain-containing protein